MRLTRIQDACHAILQVRTNYMKKSYSPLFSSFVKRQKFTKSPLTPLCQRGIEGDFKNIKYNIFILMNFLIPVIIPGIVWGAEVHGLISVEDYFSKDSS